MVEAVPPTVQATHRPRQVVSPGPQAPGPRSQGSLPALRDLSSIREDSISRRGESISLRTDSISRWEESISLRTDSISRGKNRSRVGRDGGSSARFVGATERIDFHSARRHQYRAWLSPGVTSHAPGPARIVWALVRFVWPSARIDQASGGFVSRLGGFVSESGRFVSDFARFDPHSARFASPPSGIDDSRTALHLHVSPMQRACERMPLCHRDAFVEQGLHIRSGMHRVAKPTEPTVDNFDDRTLGGTRIRQHGDWRKE